MDDIEQVLHQKIEKSQALLAQWHDSKLTEKEILQELNDILDNSVLATLKKRADIRHLLEEYNQSTSTGMKADD